MKERAYRGEQIHNPKWATEEGAQESASRVVGQVQAALVSAEAFYTYIKPGWGFWPQSPLEHATRDGMQRFGAFERSPKKFSHDCWVAITEGSYPTTTVIAASVFVSQRVSVAQLAQPAETFFLNAATDRILDEAMGQGSPDEVISSLGQSLSQNSSFQQYLTPEGRVLRVVGLTATVLAQQELRAIALERLCRGDGMGGPSPYGAAAALALEVILS